ncbi:MAG: 16S rRNA (cytosine(1402)-N(4))-methyltransferase RsmH [Cryomorphaceae bacterium]|nr:MAG: 16S rRNA (cytosine(1402)-N(4))-methyltransferase RsmH [Cryomorphaceae bacterium]
MSEYHVPVLLNESVEALTLKPGGCYVDVTFGGGGHSREILRRLDGGRLIAFDQDADARQNIPNDPRFELVDQNFRYLKNNLRLRGVKEVDGVLADLGVSSHQFDVSERGFSFRLGGPLDMRMDQSNPRTAAHVLQHSEESELADMFFKYGELSNARRVAAAIVGHRANQTLETIGELLSAIEHLAPAKKPAQFYARVFQALRIVVNDEMAALEEMLQQAADILKPGGRLVVISYHSLEDRLVKHFMKFGNFEGVPQKDFYGNLIRPMRTLTNKPVMPPENEIETNSRARSARLRIAEKL